MDTDIKLLRCGAYEELKVGVHATALTLAVVMGAYNAAAWLRRRQTHLGVNAVLYAALAAWEIQLVRHHWLARPDRDGRPARPERPVAAVTNIAKPAA